MARVESYSEYTNRDIKKFFQPGGAQIIAYGLFSAAVLTLLSSRDYWDYFIKPLSGGGNLEVSAPGGVQKVFGIISEGRLAQIIFWAVIGVVSYITVWLIKNVFFNVYNDFLAGKYVSSTHTKDSYWRGVIYRKVFFAVEAITLIAYLISLIKLLPILAKQLYFIVIDPRLVHRLLFSLAVILGTAILIYLFVLLARITLHSLVLIYKGL